MQHDSVDPGHSTPNPELAGAPRADDSGSQALLAQVYEELRRLAAARMSRLQPGQTIQPTELVHDVYLRLVSGETETWESRAQFFAAAATSMRRILIERARLKVRLKHGDGRSRVELDEAHLWDDGRPLDLLALDEVLVRFAERDPRRHQIVMLRYFAGLSIEDTAAALGSSPATVKRDWNYAKAWLYQALSERGERASFAESEDES